AAGVDASLCRERAQRVELARALLALQLRCVPVEAEPVERSAQVARALRRAARGIDVFQAQQQPGATAAGMEPAPERRQQGPRVSRSGRTGREATALAQGAQLTGCAAAPRPAAPAPRAPSARHP